MTCISIIHVYVVFRRSCHPGGARGGSTGAISHFRADCTHPCPCDASHARKGCLSRCLRMQPVPHPMAGRKGTLLRGSDVEDLSLQAGEGALSKQPDEAESAARQPERQMGGSSRAAGTGWDRRWPTPERWPGAAGTDGGSHSLMSPAGHSRRRTALPVPPGQLPLSSLCLSPAALFFCLIWLPSISEDLSHRLAGRKGFKNIGCDI